MSFGMLVIYVALLLLRPQEWWAPVRNFQLINIAAILTIFATFISQRPGQPLTETLSRNKFGRFMWALLAVVVLSDLTKFRLSYAFEAFQNFGKIAIWFFLVMIIVDTPQRLRKMMWVMVFCAAIMCVHGTMQIRTGYGFGNIKPFGSFVTGDFRIQGTGVFSDPNDFALLFIVAIAFAVTLYRQARSFSTKGFLVCSMGAMLVMLYFTQSRGGLMGFCAMLLASVWIAGRRNILRFMLSGALIGAAILLGPSRARESYTEGSAGGRIEAWGIGNEILKHSPVFGAGYEHFFDFSGDRAAHSSFVNCYAELGLAGYVVWFGMIWLVPRTLLRMARMTDHLDPPMRQLATGLFAALVGYLTSAFFLTRTYNHVLYFLLALGIGLITYVQRQYELPPRALDITQRDLFKAVMVALGSIPVIWLVIRFYYSGAG